MIENDHKMIDELLNTKQVCEPSKNKPKDFI